MSGDPIDLGHGVTATFTAWGDHDPAGLIETHAHPQTGNECGGAVLFDLPGVREAFPGRAVWQVENLAPLTISPSLLCSVCGHHGFIRAGAWVPA